jgi:hypothetical protein
MSVCFGKVVSGAKLPRSMPDLTTAATFRYPLCIHLPLSHGQHGLALDPLSMSGYAGGAA